MSSKASMLIYREEYYLFGEKETKFDEPDIRLIFHTISGYIREKCKIFHIQDTNLIKALIVYVCRKEIKCLEENPKYDGWKCEEENCTGGDDVDWDILSNKDKGDPNYIRERSHRFRSIYRCNSCLGFTNSNSISDRMEKIIRSELKMKDVKHRASCQKDQENQDESIEDHIRKWNIKDKVKSNNALIKRLQQCLSKLQFRELYEVVRYSWPPTPDEIELIDDVAQRFDFDRDSLYQSVSEYQWNDDTENIKVSKKDDKSEVEKKSKK